MSTIGLHCVGGGPAGGTSAEPVCACTAAPGVLHRPDLLNPPVHVRSSPFIASLRLLVLIALGAGSACRANLEPPGHWPVEHQPRRVFAHYMVCCPAAGSHAGAKEFEREILAAQAAGIDGFALNTGGWQREAHYRTKILAFYRAARELGTGFLLFPSADFCCGLTDDEVVDMMRSVYEHPNQFRFEGRPLLSTFTGGENLKNIADRLAAEGKPIAVVPYVFPLPPSEHPRGGEIDAAFNRVPWAEGFFFFAGPGTGEQHAETNALLAHKWLGAGRVFMAGISPYYRGYGGNYRVYETRGFEGMALQWENAIRLRIPWVELVTWNDWGEASYLAPFGDPGETRLWNGHWGPLPSHTGYLEASRHFIAWFKQGTEPAVTRDELFYFYRPHPKSLEGVVKPGDGKLGRPSGAGRLRDAIYVTAQMTAPARLSVNCGDMEETFDLAAGVHHVRAPFAPGRPRFRLERDGHTLIDKLGEHEISASDAWANFNPFAGSAAAAPSP